VILHLRNDVHQYPRAWLVSFVSSYISLENKRVNSISNLFYDVFQYGFKKKSWRYACHGVKLNARQKNWIPPGWSSEGTDTCGKMSSSNTSIPSTMNTTSKKVKKATPEVATPAPVASATPAATKTTKAKSVAAAPVVAAVPVASPVPVTAPATDAASATSADASLADEVKTLRDQLTSVRDAASAALAALKRVEKRASADVKEAKKSKRKPRVDENGERKPSNFEIPVAISDELSNFLVGHKIM
jgi:hypothetical protein